MGTLPPQRAMELFKDVEDHGKGKVAPFAEI